MKTLVGLSTAALLSIGMLAAPAANAAPYQPNPGVETRADVTRTEATITVVTSGGRKLNGRVIVRVINRQTGRVVARDTAALRRGEADVDFGKRLRKGKYKMVVLTDAGRSRFDDKQTIRFAV